MPERTAPATKKREAKEPAGKGRAAKAPSGSTGGRRAAGGTATGGGAARRGTGGGGTRLVIVESPAKARTISGYLGRGYVVESSIGHIRDLPDKAAEIPAKYKKEPWARLGVNVDAGFEPLYIVNPDKKQQVTKLRKLLGEADELLLATDEDREGEAIAWHLLEVLKPRIPARRMVFHEITPDAIAQAVANPRDLNLRLVDAQETRRILDRLYGYEISPVLWKKVMPRLSAGRVQSVATRLVVERERERIAFRSASYWDLEAVFGTGRPDSAGSGPDRAPDPQEFPASLVALDGRRVAQGRDFSSVGELKSPDVVHLGESEAGELAQRLEHADFSVRTVERKPYRRSPYPPFRTTTLQQEASRKLGFSAKNTMSVAQRLYENGHITYMRTDSIQLSETAVAAARRQARQLFGDEYVPESPRIYTSKVKNAQEAHEAIRPAGDEFRTPAATGLTGPEFRLYELIWKRTVASQMKDATGESVSVRVAGTSSAGEQAEFGASGKIIGFYGFLKAYVEDADDPEADREDRERRLPRLAEGDGLVAVSMEASGHSTRPPARYTESTLIKELEDREIGRPSTYATIIGTILDRGYVFRKGTALVPSFLAFAVTTLLEQHFGHLVDYDFTAQMEDALDAIARGEAARVPWLRRFYFGENGAADGGGNADRNADGNGRRGRDETSGGAGGQDSSEGADGRRREGLNGRRNYGLKELVSDLGEIDAREVSSFPLPGTSIVLRVGRYGPYLERDGQRANVPDQIPPDELTPDVAEELLARPSGERELGTDPETGRLIVAKSGRYGPYVTEVLEPEKPADNGGGDTGGSGSGESGGGVNGKPRQPRQSGSKSGKAAKEAKPRTASLLTAMSLDTVTLEDALRLLSLPRTLGELDGEPVTVQNGRYGPYVKKGSDSRSLESEEQLFTLTLDQARELFAQPKRRGRLGAAAAPPLRELGPDPATSKTIVIKDGRWGPYATDGETNASLRRGDSPESVTLERAAELLAERRAAGPAKPRRRSRAQSSR